MTQPLTRIGRLLAAAWVLMIVHQLAWLAMLYGWELPDDAFAPWSFFAFPTYLATAAWARRVGRIGRGGLTGLGALALFWLWLWWLARPTAPGASVSRRTLSGEPIYTIGAWSMRLLPWLVSTGALAWLVRLLLRDRRSAARIAVRPV